jgi:hypothetical protein
MKKMLLVPGCLAAALFITVCATAKPEPSRAGNSVPDELDAAIRQATD